MQSETDAFIDKLKDTQGLVLDEALWTRFYNELKKQAVGRLRGWGIGGTLSATALVHEVFLKMDPSHEAFKNKEHFLAISSLAMRQILVNHARQKNAQKRPQSPATLEAPDAIADAPQLDLVLLDQALKDLAELDPKMVAIVEARVYGGFSVKEVAECMDISQRTVDRAWSKSQGFARQKSGGDERPRTLGVCDSRDQVSFIFRRVFLIV